MKENIWNIFSMLLENSKTMEANYIKNVKQLFLYYKQLGEKTFEQIEEEDIFWKYNEASNSIAIIVKHLWGNMMSRWTDFLTADGEKEWRNREGEFEEDIQNKTELLEKWEEGWACLFKALDSIKTDNFDTMIYIRNMGHTIVEAVNRQLAHYAYHIGQIVYIGRMIKSDDWTSLSIPKGKSTEYNKEKFAKPKRNKNFTEELIEEKKPKEDGRNVLKEDQPFSYKLLKDQKAQIFWYDKSVKIVKGKEYTKFEKALVTKDEYGVQLYLAKITGNFKRGNEKMNKGK